MADKVSCPLCHNEHPAGTTWCPVLFQDISHLSNDPAPPPPPPAEPPRPPTDTELVGCPNCGALGRPGESCFQCTQTIPIRARQPAGNPVYVVLPSLEDVTIPRGREITLGRQSNIAEIRAALEAFDGVSRQHCFVTIDPVRDTLTIRDPSSLNRTWVGDDQRELRNDEIREVTLPVRVRLGHTAYLTITPGGACEPRTRG